MSRIASTALQTGNDVFVEAEMATALSGVRGTAFRALAISCEIILPAALQFPRGVAAAQVIEVSLTRRTKAAVPNISDVDVIHKFKWAAVFGTSVGYSSDWQPIKVFEPDSEILIVEDPLFIQLDTVATGATWSAVVRIEYSSQRISDIDRLTLLTASLD